ncbi:MAG: diacylglycerol kinase family protein [Polyangiaceae bacterium]
MVPLIIVNPKAAGGAAGRTFPAVRAVIERRLGRVDVLATERAGHAVDLAREAARRGRSLIVAVGGDGTLHEVANGVLDGGGGASVGYIGQGTGGDFRRTLGIEHRLDRYVEVLAAGQDARIDVGKARFRSHEGATQTRWFLNVLSVGMGGLVDQYVAETSKALGGTAAYFWASARALVRCERARLRCTVHDPHGATPSGETHEVALDTYLLAICNGRYFGAGMHVAPMAKPHDGRFEVVSLDAPNKFALAMTSRRIYTGNHLSAPQVTHFGCDRIAIDLEDDRLRSVVLLDIDGEPLGTLPLEVELVPRALSLRVGVAPGRAQMPAADI